MRAVETDSFDNPEDTMTANPAIDSDDFIQLDMDVPAHAPVVEIPADEILLDMTASSGDLQRCVDCSTPSPVDERGRCQGCAADHAPAAADFAEIASESTANASITSIGSLGGGQMAGIGFTSKEGYITAVRHGVPAHTHASYLTTLRTRYGLTSADIAALLLPGPMAETALPEGVGIKHTPTGPSIFDRPRAERQFIVGAPAAEQTETIRTLQSRDLVAGAVAEGHGVIVGWRGFNHITRGVLVERLTSIGRAEWAPKAKTSRAQAGHAVQTLTGSGYHVRAERRADAAELAAGTFRWTVGKVRHGGAIGEAYGETVLVVTLTGETLACAGNQDLAQRVRATYDERIASEVYQSSDVTGWLGGILTGSLDAVRFGVGWYVPALNAAIAGRLCAAVQGTGFGCDWILPALPVATSDQLRDGILRGLTEEVSTLLARLVTERAAAKEVRQTGDIGQKRAGSFLAELREIGKRVVAYGEVLGPDRVSAARESVRLAVVELELLLADEHNGISARFAMVWDEIELDRKRAGGVL